MRSPIRPTWPSGRRSSTRPACATSMRSSATLARCGNGVTCRSPRPGIGCRSSTSRTCPRSAGRASRSGRPRGSAELDYELEIAALIDTPAKDISVDRGEEAIGGFMIMNDWSARDLQRDETAVRLGPAKGKDFATTLGPWLVTPDELADRRSAKGFDLAATATVNGTVLSRGNWQDIHFTFGEMVERASADVQLRAGDVLGSGTVGGCCLLEIKDESGFGRYLQPGDRVVLRGRSAGRAVDAHRRAPAGLNRPPDGRLTGTCSTSAAATFRTSATRSIARRTARSTPRSSSAWRASPAARRCSITSSRRRRRTGSSAFASCTRRPSTTACTATAWSRPARCPARATSSTAACRCSSTATC